MRMFLDTMMEWDSNGNTIMRMGSKKSLLHTYRRQVTALCYSTTKQNYVIKLTELCNKIM